MSQDASDPAADLLYSNNFALQSLHEAAQATGDKGLAAAADKLREFMIRAQTTTRAGAEDSAAFGAELARAARLEGSWLRSFDFSRWEYFAQGSDWSQCCQARVLCRLSLLQLNWFGTLRCGEPFCWRCGLKKIAGLARFLCRFDKMASLAEWGPWVAETGHGGSLITMTLATVRV